MDHKTPHSIRYIDEETDQDKLYEVTLNTVQDRYFFIPSVLLNLIILGVLAFSQRKTGLRLCWVTFLSTHAHILLRTRNAKQVADFFCLANSQICKEVQRFGDWAGSIFTPSYTLIAVSDEREAQEARLRYCMSQGTKEGLCPGPTFWPGIQSASALISGSMQLMEKQEPLFLAPGALPLS